MRTLRAIGTIFWFAVCFAPIFGYGQSLTIACTGGDSTRCTTTGGTATITFTQAEQYPPDFGIGVTAIVNGTWTLQFYGAICGTMPSPASFINATTGVAISTLGAGTISATGDYKVSPWEFALGVPQGANGQYPCAAGNISTHLDFVNGGTTVSLTINYVIKPRAAFPIYTNGFGVNDNALSGHGWTLAARVPPNGFTTYLSSGPCNPVCSPYVGYTPPQNANDSIVDELGSTNTALTPRVLGGVMGYTIQESGHPPGNSDDTMIMVYGLIGGQAYVFNGPAATPSNTPLYVINGADFSSGDTGYWASDDPTIFYVLKNSSIGDSSTVMKRLKFNGGGSYTATNFAFTFPAATYGRANSDQGGHQDATADNWIPVFTKKDYAIVGTSVSATFTRSSGTLIDAVLPGQNIYIGGIDTGQTVLTVDPGTQTFVASSAFTCSGCTVTFLVPYADLAIHAPEAFTNAGYIPTVGLLQGNTPVVYNQNQLGNGGGFTMGFFPDPADGRIYGFGGAATCSTAACQTWIASFRPGIDTTMTFKVGPVRIPNPWSFGCTSIAANRTPNNSLNGCTSPAHSGPTTLADGTPWWISGDSALNSGAGTMLYRFRDSTTAPATYSNANYTGNVLIGYTANEIGSSRGTPSQKAPFYVLSTSNPSGTNWQITGCTGNPAVCTSNTSNPVANGTSVLINQGAGCGGNLTGIHTATIVSGTSFTVNVDCTVAQTGIAYVTTAAAVSFAGTDNDQITAYRSLGSYSIAQRFGHTRSVCFNNDSLFGFYCVTRAGMSMTGRYVYWATNFGTPQNVQVMSAPTNFCPGLADNAFDCTGLHAISTSTTPTSITVNFVAPTSGNVVIEIGQQQSLTDSHQDTNPSGSCPTTGWRVWSVANPTTSYQCTTWTGTSGTWAVGNPDTTYQVFYDTTGVPTHSHTFTGLTNGSTYYIRAIVANTYGATVSAIPNGVVVPLGSVRLGPSVLLGPTVVQ